MSADAPLMFPCPRCQSSRGDIEADCVSCGWSPNPQIPTTPPAKWQDDEIPTKRSSNGFALLGVFAIVLGLMMILGSLMFLIVIQLVGIQDAPFPQPVHLPGLIQLGIGLLTIVSGVLCIYRQPLGKWLFFASLCGLACNAVYFAFALFQFDRTM